MDERLLEIREYLGGGYQPLIQFGDWRIAILRWEPPLESERIEFMERHTLTDEVFVLLEGQATLILGGRDETVEGIVSQVMEQSKLYNVKQDVWHAVILSRDASILIVENDDTGDQNTEYCPLGKEFRDETKALGKGIS